MIKRFLVILAVLLFAGTITSAAAPYKLYEWSELEISAVTEDGDSISDLIHLRSDPLLGPSGYVISAIPWNYEDLSTDPIIGVMGRVETKIKDRKVDVKTPDEKEVIDIKDPPPETEESTEPTTEEETSTAQETEPSSEETEPSVPETSEQETATSAPETSSTETVTETESETKPVSPAAIDPETRPGYRDSNVSYISVIEESAVDQSVPDVVKTEPIVPEIPQTGDRLFPVLTVLMIISIIGFLAVKKYDEHK